MHPNDGRVVSNFIVQALKNEDITIFGDGNQTRSFCYVDDLIDGLVKLMNSSDDFTGPVNLGNPTESTISYLANKIIELTGSQSRIVHSPLPGDDPRKRQPLLELAKNVLNWQPRIPLVEGLKKTITYFRNFLAELPQSGTKIYTIEHKSPARQISVGQTINR
jgi:UDP-glucuronate decarboxylase